MNDEDDNRGRASAPSRLIDRPTDTDVVLGRGNAHTWRQGNTTFHECCDEHAQTYHADTTTKKMKGRIIQEIYNRITSTGRFLIRHDDTDNYLEVGESEAKVRQLRPPAELLHATKEVLSFHASPICLCRSRLATPFGIDDIERRGRRRKMAWRRK